MTNAPQAPHAHPMAREAKIDEHPYGWVIVAVATLAMALGFGANVTVSIFIDPWEAEFGWSRSSAALPYTITTIGAAIGGVIFGTLSDRIGAKKIAFLGATSMGIAMIALAQMSQLKFIYGAYFIIGFLGFACLFAPLIALSGLWFSNRKGLVIGIVTSGGAIGQGAVPFVLRFIITEYDWRVAATALGLTYLVVLLPMFLLLKPPPVLAQASTSKNRSDDNLWGLSHRLTLPWLALAGVFCCICMSVPLVHLVPLAIDLDINPQNATGILFALMGSGMIGRLVFGLVADRIGGLLGYFGASAGQTATVFWFTQTQSTTMLYLLGILFGFFFAGVMTSLLISVREAAPIRIAGFAAALVSATAWLGMGLGGFQGGYFYDLTGDYSTSYANAAFAGMINLVIVALLIRHRNQRRSGILPVTA